MPITVKARQGHPGTPTEVSGSLCVEVSCPQLDRLVDVLESFAKNCLRDVAPRGQTTTRDEMSWANDTEKRAQEVPDDMFSGGEIFSGFGKKTSSSG